MKTLELIQTLDKLGKAFYSLADLEKITGLNRASLYGRIKRLVAAGILRKLAPGVYATFTSMPALEPVAASLYQPNYLSFESALTRQGVLNLIPYTLTFATTRRSKRLAVGGREAQFRQIKRELFWGYDMSDGVYVANAEKALLDLVYLASKGLATIDFDEIDATKLEMPKLREFAKAFPGYTQRYLKEEALSALSFTRSWRR